MTRINRFNTTCHKTTPVILKFKINNTKNNNPRSHLRNATFREAIYVNVSEPNTCSIAKLKKMCNPKKMTTFVA